LRCSDPKRLQELADSLTAHDLLVCGRKWLNGFTPFFREKERKQAGCQHRLFFAQVEFCDNLIFHRRVALDALGERGVDPLLFFWRKSFEARFTGVGRRRDLANNNAPMQEIPRSRPGGPLF